MEELSGGEAAAPRSWQLRHTALRSRAPLHEARTGPPPHWLTEYDSSGLRACPHRGDHRLQSRSRDGGATGGIPPFLPQRREENEKERKIRGRAKRRGVPGAEDGRAVAW